MQMILSYYRTGTDDIIVCIGEFNPYIQSFMDLGNRGPHWLVGTMRRTIHRRPFLASNVSKERGFPETVANRTLMFNFLTA